MSQGPDNLPQKGAWCSEIVISKNKWNLFVMMGDFIIVYNFVLWGENLQTPIDHLLYVFPPYTSTYMNDNE